MPDPLAPRSNWAPPLPARPDTTEFGEIPVSPFFEWNVGDVLSALAQHEQGTFFSSALLSDYLLRDDRVFATLGTRVNGLLGLPFQIKPSPQASRPKRAIEEALREDWPRMFSRDVIGELQRWARMMGFAIAELVWHTDGPRWVPEIKVWHPANVWYYLNDRQYAVNTMQGTQFVTPGDGKWLLYKPHGYYRGWMHAGVRATAILTLLRQYCLRDMGRAGELYGLGVKKGHVPSAGAQADKARFKAQLSRLSSEGTIILPRFYDDKGNLQEFDFEFVGVDVGQGAAHLFETLAARCDSGITLTFLGQNLTSEVKEGSLAAARVHGDVRQDLLEFDVETLAEDIRAQVVKAWAKFNFGDESLAPIATWDATPPEDLQTSADALDKAASAIETLCDVAPEVDRRALLVRFKIPIIDEATPPILPEHVAMGICTPNEARASLGLPPIEGGDVLTTKAAPPPAAAPPVPEPKAA